MCQVVSKISRVVSEKRCQQVEKMGVKIHSVLTCWALCGLETNKGGVETGFAAFVMWIRYLLVSI